jgi:WD40 repeat protein
VDGFLLCDARGRKRRGPVAEGEKIVALAVSPDDSLVASVEKGSCDIRIWDAGKLAEAGFIKMSRPVGALAWGADGMLAVGHRDSSVVLVRSPAGEVLSEFSVPLAPNQDLEFGSVRSVALSPASDRVAVIGNRGFMAVWRVGAETRSVYATPPQQFYQAAFSPDGRYLAAAASRFSISVGEAGTQVTGDGSVWLLDVLSGASRSTAVRSLPAAVVWPGKSSSMAVFVRLLPPDRVQRELWVFAPEAIGGCQEPSQRISGGDTNSLGIIATAYLTGASMIAVAEEEGVTGYRFEP